MWHSASERHEHCQGSCNWWQYNGTPCEECNTCVVLMERICHRISGAKQMWWVCQATSRLGYGEHVFVRHRVRGSVRAVRSVRNSQVFLTECRAVAEVDTLCEVETDRSCLGTRSGILVSTCKQFDCWLCNPRVSGRGGSGLGMPSWIRQECCWITAREAAHSAGGCTSHNQTLGATTIDDLQASEQVVWTFFLNVGDSTGLQGVTVEGTADGEGDSPQALDGWAESSGGSGQTEALNCILVYIWSALWNPKGGTWSWGLAPL